MRVAALLEQHRRLRGREDELVLGARVDREASEHAVGQVVLAGERRAGVGVEGKQPRDVGAGLVAVLALERERRPRKRVPCGATSLVRPLAEGAEALLVLELCIGERQREAHVRRVLWLHGERLLALLQGETIPAADERACALGCQPSQVGPHGERAGNVCELVRARDGVTPAAAALEHLLGSLDEEAVVLVWGGGLCRRQHAARVMALGVELKRLTQELPRLGDCLGGRGVGCKGKLVVDELGGSRDEVERPVLVRLGQRVALLAVAVPKVHGRARGAKWVARAKRPRKPQAESLEVLVVWIERHTPSLLVLPMVRERTVSSGRSTVHARTGIRPLLTRARIAYCFASVSILGNIRPAR